MNAKPIPIPLGTLPSFLWAALDVKHDGKGTVTCDADALLSLDETLHPLAKQVRKIVRESYRTLRECLKAEKAKARSGKRTKKDVQKEYPDAYAEAYVNEDGDLIWRIWPDHRPEAERDWPSLGCGKTAAAAWASVR